MRPRIRTIKPEALKHDDLWDLELETGLPIFRAFVGLWCMSDREGRFDWRPRMLKPDILPHWDGDFSRVLDALVTRGFIVRYSVDGKEYGWVPSFKEHQVINNREEPSRLPPPPEFSHSKLDSDACPTRAPRDDDACPTPLCKIQGEGNGREGKGTEGNGNVACATDAPPVAESASRPEPEPPTPPKAPSARSASTLDKLLQMPIRQRAQKLLEREHEAQWLEPHRWPEVQDLATRFARALKWTDPRMGATTSAVLGLVRLLAEFDGAELDRAILAAPGDPWLTSGRKGLGSLSVEVVSRLLTPLKPPPGQAHRQPDYAGEPTFRAADLFAEESHT